MRRTIFLTSLLACTACPSERTTTPGDGVFAVDAFPAITNQTPLSITGTKPSGAGVTIDGEEAVAKSAETTWTVSLDLVEGANTFELAAGATAPVTIEVVLDRAPPAVAEVTPIDRATDVPLNTQITVVFTEAIDCDAVTPTTVVLSANGSVAAEVACQGSSLVVTPSANLAPSVELSVTVLPEVKDLAGNFLVDPFNWRFTTGTEVDTTPPADPTITSQIPATTYDGLFRVTGTKEAGANVEAQWYVDGALRADWSAIVARDASATWQHDFTLVNGANRYVLRSVDGAANTSCDAACATEFAITKEDNPQNVNPPVVRFVTPTDAPRQVLNGTKDADTGIEIDGALVVPPGPETDWFHEVTLTPGTTSLSIRARDGFGNTSSPVLTDIDYAPGANVSATADLKIQFELWDLWDAIGDEYRITDGKREIGTYAPIIWLEGPIPRTSDGGTPNDFTDDTYERCYFDDAAQQRLFTRYVATLNFNTYGNADGSWGDLRGHWWEPNYFVSNWFASLVEAGVFDRSPQPIAPTTARRDHNGQSWWWAPGDGGCPPTWYRLPNNNCKPRMAEQAPIDAITEASLQPRFTNDGTPLLGNRMPLGQWTTGLITYPRRPNDDPQSRRPQARPNAQWRWRSWQDQPVRQGAYLLQILFVLDRSSPGDQSSSSGGASQPYQWNAVRFMDSETCWDDTAHALQGAHRAEGIVVFGDQPQTIYLTEKGPTNEAVDACHNPRNAVRCNAPNGNACDWNANGAWSDPNPCSPPASGSGSVRYVREQPGWPAPIRVDYCPGGPCP